MSEQGSDFGSDDDRPLQERIDRLPPIGSAGGRPGRVDTRTGDRHAYRLRGMRFLLTYPQCPHAAALRLSQKCTDMGSGRYLVCKELHADGGQHLHAYVEFPTARCYNSPGDWDFADDGGITYHGNYQAARSARRAAAYVAKDGEFISRGYTPAELDVLRRQGRPATDFSALGKRLLDGEAIEEIYRENPCLIWNKDIQKVRMTLNSVRLYDAAVKDSVLKSIPFYGRGLRWDFAESVSCRAGPDGQYFPFIFGAPNCGKSTLLKTAGAKPYKYNHTPGAIANWVAFDSNLCDCIVFDDASVETLKAVGYSTVNALCNGDLPILNNKGGAARPHKWMPVIIITNYSPSVLFPGRDPLALACASRFWFYYVQPAVPGGRYDALNLPIVTLFKSISSIPTHILDENGPAV